MAILRNWRAFASSYQFTVLVVAVAAFTDAYIYGMVLPIIPDLLRGRIGVDPKDVQIWTSVILAIFGGFFLLTPPIVGHISDLSASKRAPFLAGLIVMAVATLLFFTATSLPPLLVGRALQAVSCSFCFACGLSLVTSATPPGKKGAAMGFVALGNSIGDLCGPLFGGFIYTKGGHNAMFAVALAVILVDVVLRLLVRDQEKPNADEEATATDATLHRNTNGNLPSNDVHPTEEVRPLLTNETSTKTVPPETVPPISRFRMLFSQPRIWASFWAMTMVAIVRNSFGSVLTISLAEQFGWDTSISGVVFFVFFSASFLSPVQGHVSEKKGARLVSIFVFGTMTILTAALGFATPNTTFTKTAFVTLLFCTGFCTSTALAAHEVAVAEIAEDIEKHGYPTVAGLAFSVIMCGWGAGMLLGPLLGTAMKLRFGWEGLCFSVAMLNGLTTVIMFFFCHGASHAK